MEEKARIRVIHARSHSPYNFQVVNYHIVLICRNKVEGTVRTQAG